ncbi:MAG: cytochrome c bioproteinis protein [Elusimicrobia bacterium]|nr:MAG: cytochrome c bioproteinis protein [Elusimicrobiota bacterium]
MLKGLLLVAFGFYAAAFALALAYLAARDERLPRWMWVLLGLGAFFHLGSFCSLVREFWTWNENRYFFPVVTAHGVFSWLAFTNALVFLVVEGVGRLGILGAFVLPWTLLAAGAALLTDPGSAALAPNLQSYWLNIHPMLLMLAYTGFANAFGVGAALLTQERQIKSRKPSELCYRLPALQDLDRLHVMTLAFSWPVMTAGLAMGAVWSNDVFGRPFNGTAKEYFAFGTWALYAALLLAHRFRGLRGRRSVHLAMAAFAVILVSMAGVSHFPSAR